VPFVRISSSVAEYEIVFEKINAIRPIYLKREFDAPAEKNANTLSYKRSMSASRFVPLPISCLDPYRIMHLTDSQRCIRSRLVFHSMGIEHIRHFGVFIYSGT
jgi:hypothetical protein